MRTLSISIDSSQKTIFLILCHPGGNKRWWISSRWWTDLFAQQRILKKPLAVIFTIISSKYCRFFLPFIRIISYWWRMNDKRWGVNDLLECTYYQLEYKGISSKRILRSLVSNKNSIAQIKNLLSRRIETMNEMGKPRTKYLYKMDDVICKQ